MIDDFVVIGSGGELSVAGVSAGVDAAERPTMLPSMAKVKTVRDKHNIARPTYDGIQIVGFDVIEYLLYYGKPPLGDFDVDILQIGYWFWSSRRVLYYEPPVDNMRERPYHDASVAFRVCGSHGMILADRTGRPLNYRTYDSNRNIVIGAFDVEEFAERHGGEMPSGRVAITGISYYHADTGDLCNVYTYCEDGLSPSDPSYADGE